MTVRHADPSRMSDARPRIRGKDEPVLNEWFDIYPVRPNLSGEYAPELQ